MSEEKNTSLKLVNGKFKPKCSKGMFFENLILDLCLIGITTIFICEVLKLGSANFAVLIICAVLIPLLDYVILLSPYQQYTENYYIEFKSENTLEGFKLFYRKKELKVECRIDENGKLVFDKENEAECVSYADGTKLSNLTRNRIVNYFIRWLKDNDLM